jgi:uncharacterized protein (DUF58 family)
MSNKLFNWAGALKDKWLDKRIPASQEYRFDLNNTFILPTGFGWTLIFVAILLFVLGTNYQNNLVLLLSFFALAIVLLSLFHSFYFFTRITIKFIKNEELFANQPAFLNIKVINESDIVQARLYYQHQYSQHKTNQDRRGRSRKSIVRTLTMTTNEQEHQLLLGALPRGQHMLPRITFFSSYPFGLFKTWSHLAVSDQLMIFPEPLQNSYSQKLSASQKDESGENQLLEQSSSEELQGIREYKDEDPIHHVSWKHVAKGQGMLSKEFAAHQSSTVVLDLKLLNEHSLEDALSMLCFSVMQLSQTQQQFGLNLGTQQILPSNGDQHRQQCLKALSLFSPQRSSLNKQTMGHQYEV